MADRSVAVIKDDLKFAGQRVKIFSQGKIEIDCEFAGDVSGPEVVVGERGKLKGNIFAERVVVIGKIFGGIHGKFVALKSSARVDGDIHHGALTIDKGAAITGRCKHLG
jgi:cytoskeletal protein CcmA (bactofilin family)